MTMFARVTTGDFQECRRTTATILWTPRGVAEYAERGEGPVILCVHGAPGGFDPGLGLGEVFRANGFRTIAISRPGYLGTPLSSRHSPEEQADLIAALLRTKGLERVAVLGTSAGGPASYLLAARHPRLVLALIEIDAVSQSYAPVIGKLDKAIYLSRVGGWLTHFAARHFPETVARDLLRTESTLDHKTIIELARRIIDDPAKLECLRLIVDSFAEHFERRRQGLDNDLGQLSHLAALPLSTITCPALIVHGDADKDVDMDHARHAHACIARADLYLIEGGSHLGFWLSNDAEQAQRHAVDWLKAAVSE